MHYFQFLDGLRKKSISRTYIFCGEEDFLKCEALERFAQILFREKGVKEKEIFEADVDACVLSEKLNTVSLFGTPALIVIKKTSALDEKCRLLLQQYILQQNPVKGVLLPENYLVVFLDKDEDRAKWCGGKRADEIFVEFKKSYEKDTITWLIARAGDNNKILRRDRAAMLVEMVGGDLAFLSEALERIINYTGQKKEIGIEDIQGIIGDEKRDAIFDIASAMASRDLGGCLAILKKLFLTLTPPQQIMGLLAWKIRQLYTVKKGGKVKIPAYLVDRLKNEAKKFSMENLEECLSGLRYADADIKEGLKNPRLALELFFFKCLKPGETKAQP